MTSMTYHVHSVEQDLAGKWYARVVITKEKAVFLKFDDFPTMDQIQDAARLYTKEPNLEELTNAFTE